MGILGKVGQILSRAEMQLQSTVIHLAQKRAFGLKGKEFLSDVMITFGQYLTVRNIRDSKRVIRNFISIQKT